MFPFNEPHSALAHRIPLYIPPYAISKEQGAEYDKLEILKNEAVKKLDFDERDRLTTEQMALATFKPWMQHSFDEKSKTVYFHPQMLCDFATIEKIAWAMIKAIDS